jgi:hypothetical protein
LLITLAELLEKQDQLGELKRELEDTHRGCTSGAPQAYGNTHGRIASTSFYGLLAAGLCSRPDTPCVDSE